MGNGGQSARETRGIALQRLWPAISSDFLVWVCTVSHIVFSIVLIMFLQI